MIDYAAYRDGLKSRELERKTYLEKRRQKALILARQIADMLRRDFEAGEIYLFGSTLRPGEFHAHSDIDLAVKGIAPQRYFAAVGQAMMMTEDLSVDLFDFSDCRPELQSVILREGRSL